MWWKSVRSIIAFVVVSTFCVMAIRGQIPTEGVTTVVGVVITFYFLKDRPKTGENQ